MSDLSKYKNREEWAKANPLAAASNPNFDPVEHVKARATAIKEAEEQKIKVQKLREHIANQLYVSVEELLLALK